MLVAAAAIVQNGAKLDFAFSRRRPVTSNDKQLAAARKIAALIAPHLQGDLSLQLWNGEVVPLGPGARDDVRIVVRSPGAIRRLLLKPSLMNVFELYADGELDITGAAPLDATLRWDHLKALHLKDTVDKVAVAKAALPFLTWRAPPQVPVLGFTNEAGSVYGKDRRDQEMVSYHYDVSDAFYALFLDREMVYSAGYFESEDDSVDQAQIVKMDRICKKLQLAPGKRMLDIGCGWGGLACYAAKNYGVDVYGMTLSKRQHAYAQEKIAAMGLKDKVRIDLKDYREIVAGEPFDAIAQIEMFEHVGLDNHDRHFAHINRLLKTRGTYLHQAMTRRAPMDLTKFRKRTAYAKVLQRYIFPGYELDHLGMTITNLERHGFEVHDVDNMREHYHLTLRRWADRLWANREAAIAEAGLQRTRLWLLYLALVCRGFDRGPVLVYQTLATKRDLGRSGLPLARKNWFK